MVAKPRSPVPPAPETCDEDIVAAPHWHIEAIREGLREAEAGNFADDAEVDAVFEKWRRAR